MRAFFSFALTVFILLALIVYSGWFFWLNTRAATFDYASKMVTIYFWRGLEIGWLPPTMGLKVRLSELALFAPVGACLLGLLLGWIWGWRTGRKGVPEQRHALQQAQTELQQARQQVAHLQTQLLDAYRQHELRLTDLTEKLLSVTKAALPAAELQVESLPLVEAPALPEQKNEPSSKEPST